MNDYFRIYTNNDVIGVETGAALKNIIAIGAGAIHGLGFGDDAKAAIMTRGLAEISRLGVAMGASRLYVYRFERCWGLDCYLYKCSFIP